MADPSDVATNDRDPVDKGPIVRAVGTTLAGVALAVVAYVNRDWLGAWLTSDPFVRWLYSPGFGGSAAFFAATIAYLTHRSRLRHDAAAADEEREEREARQDAERADALETAERQRWWQMLVWIYDRATEPDPARRLDVDVTIGLLVELEKHVHDDFERGLLAGALEVFDEGHSEDVGDVASEGGAE